MDLEYRRCVLALVLWFKKVIGGLNMHKWNWFDKYGGWFALLIAMWLVILLWRIK